MTFFAVRLLIGLSVSCVALQAMNGLQINTHPTIAMESVDLKLVPYFSNRLRLGHHLVIDLTGCDQSKIKKVVICRIKWLPPVLIFIKTYIQTRTRFFFYFYSMQKKV